mmetsp:Transcript_14999/g.35308  ORF Transcript_14999/g.35308 Transcript_14999/m.35308 type:complete len:121 (-) Transcript_14999:123-485(-)
MCVTACQACGKFSALSTTHEKASSATAGRSKRDRRGGCRWCGLLEREAAKYRSAATAHARTEASNRARVEARAAEAKYGKAPVRPAGTEFLYPPKKHDLLQPPVSLQLHEDDPYSDNSPF